MVSAYSNWGRVLQAEGRYEEARQYFQRALETAQHQAGSYTLSRVLSNFAPLEFDSKSYRAAEEKSKTALSLQRAMAGGQSAPDTALTMITFAEARRFQHDPASAEPILRQALDILKNKLPAR
jgi:tetratricopeptide (TPR) repeat protein